MSFYEPQGWQAPVRQSSWEQPPPPSRSGASSTSQRDDGIAFATQFEEVDRAVDNLVKSGKFYSPGPRPMQMSGGSGRQFGENGPRSHGGRHSVNEFDPARSHSASNLQNFYASQRYQGGRHNEAEQMMQAKRRMAAQRERELRNYHQEQQFNRSGHTELPSNKSDRSMSPSTISEEGRRELIARQHRALYGNEGSTFSPESGYSDDQTSHEQSGNTSGPPTSTGRGSSPRGVDAFGASGQIGDIPSQNMQQDPLRGEKNSSPSGAGGFGSGKAPSPKNNDDGAHSRQISKSTTAPLTGGMAPIGSRPTTQHVPGQGLNKRTTSPLPPVNYSFGATEQNNERSGSSNSNSNIQKESSSNSGIGAWGTGSGVWGTNKIGATSVWG